MKTCSFEGCGRKLASRGLCSGHNKQRRKGNKLAPLRTHAPKGTPAEDKIMKTCSFEGCGRKFESNGLCSGHNQQIRKGNKLAPLRTYAPKGLPAEDKLNFWLDKSKDCWMWIAGTNPGGYGQVSVDGKMQMAHRVAYTVWVGEIPKGFSVHHKCANRLCCNPEHLQLATHRDNMAEMFERKALKARIAELEARVAELEKELNHAS